MHQQKKPSLTLTPRIHAFGRASTAFLGGWSVGDTTHSATEMHLHPDGKEQFAKEAGELNALWYGLKLRLGKKNKGKTVPYVSQELALLLYRYANTSTHVLQKIAEN